MCQTLFYIASLKEELLLKRKLVILNPLLQAKLELQIALQLF